MIASRPVKLRPQMAAWEREVPSGSGVTGLWRPASGDMVFTFRQEGNALNGSMESTGGCGFGGGAAGGVIEDGKVDGTSVSFRVGNTTYAATASADRIELTRSGGGGRGGRGGRGAPPGSNGGPRPAIGPPPDGTDPSFGAGGRGLQQEQALVLRRATR